MDELRFPLLPFPCRSHNFCYYWEHRYTISLSIAELCVCVVSTTNTTGAGYVQANFLFLVPWFFGVPFGFWVLCFAFYFFSVFVSPCEHTLNILHSKQEVAKETHFIHFYVSLFFATIIIIIPLELVKQKARKDIPCRVWSSVLCKLQKSLAHILACIFTTRMKLRKHYFVSLVISNTSAISDARRHIKFYCLHDDSILWSDFNQLRVTIKPKINLKLSWQISIVSEFRGCRKKVR